VQDDAAAPGTKHQLAGAGTGTGDMVDGKGVLPRATDDTARVGDGRAKPPPPPDPEPSPWKLNDPTVEPEPSPWGGGVSGGTTTTGSDPARGHKAAKLTHVLDD
jgi:hypothetical protein